jgi:hypothetical protein
MYCENDGIYICRCYIYRQYIVGSEGFWQIPPVCNLFEPSSQNKSPCCFSGLIVARVKRETGIGGVIAVFSFPLHLVFLSTVKERYIQTKVIYNNYNFFLIRSSL